MSRSMDDVMDGLAPILGSLDAIPRAAVATYRGYPPSVLLEHSPRAAANCVYTHMEVAARQLEAEPGVIFRDVRGLKVWIFRDLAVIRFKRMDEGGRYRRYPTKQAKDYDCNRPLPNLPLPAERLVVGYLLDATATEVVRVQVARPSGRDIDWCAAIVPPDEKSAAASWVEISRRLA